MTTSEMFQSFLGNLQITNAENISLRYGEVTSSLNRKFRNSDSKANNSLQVGSYGRYTGINGISDLDMLYLMPANTWDDYKDNQSKLLTDTKEVIKARYPSTTVKVDRLVVQIVYSDFMIEVQPVYEQNDGSFKYPDTYNGGSWKVTKPRDEIVAMKEFVDQKNKNLRKLCKMARAWKNKHGVGIGGLLIDTLAYNFLKSCETYNDKSYMYYDWLSRDFFKYLSEEPNKDYYAALGSKQRVKVRSKFQKKAAEAYNLCLKAIEAGSSESANKKWKKVFGRSFPAATTMRMSEAASTFVFRNTEQFIEDTHPVDIKYSVTVECEVTQNGYRPSFLRNMLYRRVPLIADKRLDFFIKTNNVPNDFTVKWKVLNRGTDAERRDCIRGQVFSDSGHHKHRERTNFKGAHIVECYVIRHGVVVAKDRIDVPIQ